MKNKSVVVVQKDKETQDDAEQKVNFIYFPASRLTKVKERENGGMKFSKFRPCTSTQQKKYISKMENEGTKRSRGESKMTRLRLTTKCV